MDLRDYFRLLHRNWILIVSFALSGMLGGGAAAMLVAPTYTADTELFVAIQNSGSIQELQQGNTFTQARIQSYVKTATTPIVLQPALDSLGLDMSPDALASKINASSDPETVLINISVSDNSPVRAAAIAQAVANSLITVLDELERPRTGGSSPVGLSIVTPAQAPLAPSAPNASLNVTLGLMVGLILGIGAAALRTALDNRVRGEADIRAITSVPILGGIAFDQKAGNTPLLTHVDHQSPRAESFRQLRTNLQFANLSGHAKTLVVTSSLPGEGKSTTATNLALSLAQAGQSVCLIDADLRRPMVNEYLGLERGAGLTTALIGAADVEDLLQSWGEDQIFVLTSGQIPPNPSELLGSDEMNRLLSHLEGLFDTIIIDAPPILPVTDATVLCQHASGVILVVGSNIVTTQNMERAVRTLELVDANILGIVLNRVPGKGPDAYSYRYDSYTSTAPPRFPSKKGRFQRGLANSASVAEEPAEPKIDRIPRKFPRSTIGQS